MKKILILLLLINPFLYGDDDPLFGGSLLGFYATNIDPGHVSVQPYGFAADRYGFYDGNSKLNRLPDIHQYVGVIIVETGITKVIDIQFAMSAGYIHSNHVDTTVWGDFNALLGFKIAENDKKTWTPDAKFFIGESFPTGKFDELNPLGFGGDGIGSGAFQTSLILAVRKIFYNIKNHPYNFNLNLIYVVSSSAVLRGVSVYGGLSETRGIIYPGDQFIGNIAFEYLFSKHWGAALDVRYAHQNSDFFHSKTAFERDRTLPSTDLFSLAPALEYNVNEKFSMEAGVWFSVCGRNAIAFTTAVASVYWYF